MLLHKCRESGSAIPFDINPVIMPYKYSYKEIKPIKDHYDLQHILITEVKSKSERRASALIATPSESACPWIK